jgi:hypothetical protein
MLVRLRDFHFEHRDMHGLVTNRVGHGNVRTSTEKVV